VLLVDYEWRVERQLGRAEHAVFGRNQKELDALIEGASLDVSQIENLKCCFIKYFDFFRLLSQHKFHVLLPVLSLEAHMSFLKMSLSSLAQQSF